MSSSGRLERSYLQESDVSNRVVSVENSIKPASWDLFIGLESGVVSHTQKHIAATLRRLISFAQRLSVGEESGHSCTA